MSRRLARLAKAVLPLLLLAAAGPLFAASEADVDIDVTIAGALSVSVDAVHSSTRGAVWDASVPNQQLVSASSVTITNDSGGLTEKWALSTDAQSVNAAGGSAVWTLASSTSPALPGDDQFAVQAVFGSSNTAAGSCPGVGAQAWNEGFAQPLTAVPVTYTSTVFADTLDAAMNAGGATAAPDVSSGPHDGRVFASHKRALCWRVIAPYTSSTADTQNIQIIVTAQSP